MAAALCSAVRLSTMLTSTAFTFEPEASRSSHTADWPQAAALCSGVAPHGARSSSSFAFAFAFASTPPVEPEPEPEPVLALALDCTSLKCEPQNPPLLTLRAR